MKMERAGKGQISLEFLAGIGFLLSVFILFSFLAYQKSTESNELKSYLHAKMICRSLAENINTVAEQGHSYYKYFTLPEKIYGNYDYELSSYGNRLQISWESNNSPYSLPIETQNLTIHCLDKGGNQKNKIISDHEELVITCYRADLAGLAGSFEPSKVAVGELVNLSIRIKNAGILSSGDFTVSFNSQPVIISLEPEERRKIKVEYSAPAITGNYSIAIIVDSSNEVVESIESDNSLTVTVEVA